MNLTFSGILVLVACAGPLAMAQESEYRRRGACRPPSSRRQRRRMTDEQRAEEIDDLEPVCRAQVLMSDEPAEVGRGHG